MRLSARRRWLLRHAGLLTLSLLAGFYGTIERVELPLDARVRPRGSVQPPLL